MGCQIHAIGKAVRSLFADMFSAMVYIHYGIEDILYFMI